MAAAAGLVAIEYSGWVAIEQREGGRKGEEGKSGTARSTNVAAVERAVKFAKSVYAGVIK